MDWTVRRTGRGWAAQYLGDGLAVLVQSKGSAGVSQTSVSEAHGVLEQNVIVGPGGNVNVSQSQIDAAGAILNQAIDDRSSGWVLGLGAVDPGGPITWGSIWNIGDNNVGAPNIPDGSTQGIDDIGPDRPNTGVLGPWSSPSQVGDGSFLIHRQSGSGENGSLENIWFNSGLDEIGSQSATWSSYKDRDTGDSVTETKGTSKGTYGDEQWTDRTVTHGDKSSDETKTSTDGKGNTTTTTIHKNPDGTGTWMRRTVDKNGKQVGQTEVATLDPKTGQPKDPGRPGPDGVDEMPTPTSNVRKAMAWARAHAGPPPPENSDDRPAFNQRLSELARAAARAVIGPVHHIGGGGWGDAASESPDLPDPEDLGIAVKAVASADADGWGTLLNPRALIAFAGEIDMALASQRNALMEVAGKGVDHIASLAPTVKTGTANR